MSLEMEPTYENRPENRDLRTGLQLSLAFHILLAVTIAVKSLVFPSDALIVPPVLRVDIVGLPDTLKKDRHLIQPKAEEAQEQTAATPAQPAAKEEIARPDEMVVKPKVVKNKKDEAKKREAQEQRLAEEQRKERENRMKNALNRLKSLSKLSAESQASATVVKGNRVSPGSSLSDEAREAGQASYYDTLRDHLQRSWALPKWLIQQNRSAQVLIYIDAYGRMRNVVFVRNSGNPQFDAEVKRTLQESQPFPIPPGTVAQEVLNRGVRIGFPL